MGVSVIISNLNGARFLPKLLSSLADQRMCECEVIVVDRQSTDDSLTILAQHPHVRVISEPPETGLVSGYALGAKIARFDHLFFCNEDMWFDPDCLSALESNLDLSAHIGACDAWQWSYDGSRLIHAGVRFRPFFWDVFSPYPKRMQLNLISLPTGTDIPFGCASAVIIHRKMYEELGGWDTQFFLDCEDMDFFLRGWQHGWRCVTVPEAKAYHAINASNLHHLANVNQTVSQRRYISARANTILIGLKSFSGIRLLLPVFIWISVLWYNLKRCRLRELYWDFQALVQVICRLPAALRHRLANVRWNRVRPGEQFFTLPEFNLSKTDLE